MKPTQIIENKLIKVGDLRGDQEAIIEMGGNYHSVKRKGNRLLFKRAAKHDNYTKGHNLLIGQLDSTTTCEIEEPIRDMNSLDLEDGDCFVRPDHHNSYSFYVFFSDKLGPRIHGIKEGKMNSNLITEWCTSKSFPVTLIDISFDIEDKIIQSKHKEPLKKLYKGSHFVLGGQKGFIDRFHTLLKTTTVNFYEEGITSRIPSDIIVTQLRSEQTKIIDKFAPGTFVKNVVGKEMLYLGKNGDMPVFLTSKGEIHKFKGLPPSPLRSEHSKPLYRKGIVKNIRVNYKDYKEIVKEE